MNADTNIPVMFRGCVHTQLCLAVAKHIINGSYVLLNNRFSSVDTILNFGFH